MEAVRIFWVVCPESVVFEVTLYPWCGPPCFARESRQSGRPSFLPAMTG